MLLTKFCCTCLRYTKNFLHLKSRRVEEWGWGWKFVKHLLFVNYPFFHQIRKIYFLQWVRFWTMISAINQRPQQWSCVVVKLCCCGSGMLQCVNIADLISVWKASEVMWVTGRRAWSWVKEVMKSVHIPWSSSHFWLGPNSYLWRGIISCRCVVVQNTFIRLEVLCRYTCIYLFIIYALNNKLMLPLPSPSYNPEPPPKYLLPP